MNPRGASVLGACAAWILSAAPFFLDAGAFEGLSRAALAALPWIAYAGLPRRDRGDALAELAFECALFAPPLVLGLLHDLALGMERAHAAVLVAGSVACALLAALAARESARTQAARTLYTVAWCVLVAGIPVLYAALVLGSASAIGTAPAWLAQIARASPIEWSVANLALDGDAPAWPFVPAALCAALFVFALLAARRADAEAAP